MNHQRADRGDSFPSVGCRRVAYKHAGGLLVRSGTAAAVGLLMWVTASCAGTGTAAPAAVAADTRHSVTSSIAESTRTSPGPSRAVIRSGTGAATAEASMCGLAVSGFPLSIAAGATGASTPAKALAGFLTAPPTSGYGAALDQWHIQSRSAESVRYSAGTASVNIDQPTDKGWFVTGGESCHPATGRPMASTAAPSSH